MKSAARSAVKIVDALLALVIGLVGLGSFALRAASARIPDRPQRSAALASGAGHSPTPATVPTPNPQPPTPNLDPDPRILYLGTGNMDQVGPRNGMNLFLMGETSDFGGFFSRVYNVSFPAGQRKRWALTDRHTLIDVDLPIGLFLGRLGLRYASLLLREVAFLHWALGFVRRNRVSILEATNPYLQGLNAYLLARACQVPYAVLVTRDYDFDYQSIGKLAFPTLFPSRRIEKLVERWVFRRADLVLADRAYYLNYGIASGARPERARQTRVVVDQAYYSEPASRPPVRDNLGLNGRKLLLNLGRLQPDKLCEDVVRCLALVRERGVEVELAFAGDGEQQPQLERLAEELGVRPYVRFLGAQPLDVLPSLMAEADAIVCAHMGYTLVEAALSGRPMVTYDYEWHPEVIQPGRTGILVPFRDVEAMADQVVRILSDPGLAAQLGSQARAFALQHHGREAVMERYRAYYHSVLDPDDGRAELPSVSPGGTGS